MITSEDEQNLVASFHALRHTARSDEDILSWLQSNTAFAPEVPECMIPYLVIKLNDDETYTGTAENKDVLARNVAVDYKAVPPNGPAKGISMSDFEDLLSTKTFVVHNNQSRVHVERTIRLRLPALEWPYAAALAAWEVLTTDRPPSKEFYGNIEKTWEKVFPTKPWSFVQSGFVTGILPDDPTLFVEWACSASPTSAVTQDLPTDLNP